MFGQPVVFTKRSAKLVAASLAGLVAVMVSHDPTIKKVCLTAEGSLFWSKVKSCKEYNKLVSKFLKFLLDELGHGDVKVKVAEIQQCQSDRISRCCFYLKKSV